jgi:hypothetical protein
VIAALVVGTTTMIVLLLIMMLIMSVQIMIVIDIKGRMVTMISITLPSSIPNENGSRLRRHEPPSVARRGQRKNESGFRRGSRGRGGRDVERIRFHGPDSRYGVLIGDEMIIGG